MVTAPKQETANRLLAALPPAAYRRMSSDLQRVKLSFGQVLYEPGKAIREVYFPNDCMISMVVVVQDGAGVEVGLVGRESTIGYLVALGAANSPVRVLVQGEGTAMRMRADRFVKELERNRPLQKQLKRCTYISMATAMQIAACNKTHLLESRLARWLLMVRDRLSSDEFTLTQEFLAQMLGVRRAGVTAAASALQRRQLIYYRRGKIRIVKPNALREAACTCYEVIRKLENDAH
jgi:CRP-like cAMP-binding protein